MTETSIAHERVPLLDVSNLCVHFPVRVPGRLLSRRGMLAAVNGIDLTLSAGETLAIVGESGCGKSTLAKTLVGLLAPNAGSVCWQGQPLCQDGRAIRDWPRRDIQMIFQDPLASLDPRMTVYQLIAQALQLYEPQLRDDEVRARVHAMMEKVGLSPLTAHRFPHEFSGGQCQRIGIARALVSSPKLLICDEPVSALDVSIRAQIINLLMDMQRAYGLAIVFIAHDLAVVRHIATRVMVMYLGGAVEEGGTHELFDQPRHPYTRMLLSAVPIADPVKARARRHVAAVGELPSPIAVPSGCPFHTRCAQAESRCACSTPPWQPQQRDNHRARCHLA